MLFLLAAPARAAEEAPASGDVPLEAQAVQNRRFRLNHEFAVGGGTLPVDPYTKGWSANGAYAWHLSDLWAAELRGGYVFNVRTSLREKLENSPFNRRASEFARVLALGQLGALFKPLYGKLAFLNDSEVYGELFFSLYGAVARLQGGKASEDNPMGQPDRLAFGGAPGFGIRGFFTEHLSARFDFNWLVLVDQGGAVHAPLSMTFNLALTTRGDL